MFVIVEVGVSNVAEPASVSKPVHGAAASGAGASGAGTSSARAGFIAKARSPAAVSADVDNSFADETFSRVPFLFALIVLMVFSFPNENKILKLNS
jgi:hypothetical protein